MEEIARDFGGSNCCDKSNFKFKVFDRFGTMYGFHLLGKAKFQTNVGSFMTLGWLALVCITFLFYGGKLLDKTQPVMQTNRQRNGAFPSVDLQDENFHFYWSFTDLMVGGEIKWDKWWENFSMYASMLTFGVDGTYSWRNIPIVKCETQDWWSKNIKEELREKKNIYFCLD
jgi:hypothetical protein